MISPSARPTSGPPARTPPGGSGAAAAAGMRLPRSGAFRPPRRALPVPTTDGLVNGQAAGTAIRRPRADIRLIAARVYVRNGWPVFVLGRSKRPVANCPGCTAADASHDRAGCGCLTCHGFYAATTDPDRLAAMLAAVPRGLLAIRTGAASGLLVVDIDPRNGGQLDRALMTPTAAVATGGGGWHLYYRHPGVPTVAELPGHPGVDIKGDGGYVAAPPSVHPRTHQAYQWAGQRAVTEMPPALRTAITRPAAPGPAAPRQATRNTPRGGDLLTGRPAYRAPARCRGCS